MTPLVFGDLELVYIGSRGKRHFFENQLGDIRIEFAKNLDYDHRIYWYCSLLEEQVADIFVDWFAENFGPRFLEKNW